MLPIRNPAVIYQALAEGGVLFSPEDEIYFGLNPVGAEVWELLPPRCGDLQMLVSVLKARYPDVGREEIVADVTELVEQLRADRLVIASPQFAVA